MVIWTLIIMNITGNIAIQKTMDTQYACVYALSNLPDPFDKRESLCISSQGQIIKNNS